MKRNYTQWTEEEIDILKKNGTLGYNHIKEYLPNKTYNAIRWKRSQLGIKTIEKSQNPINQCFFETPSEYLYYFAGFIAADGSLFPEQGSGEIRLVISQKDSHILNEIANHIFIKDSNKNISNVSNNGFAQTRLRFRSNKAISFFKTIGIERQKTFRMCPKNIPSEHIHHFIRGYFDGDGSFYLINKKRKGFNILGNKPTLDFINQHIPTNQKVRKRTDCNIFIIQKTGDKAVELFMEYLYKDANIYLNRKRNAFD